jgi:hypothetical protein
MPFLQTNPDGSLLLENGHLVSSEECCCDECPPLGSMPTVCQVKLTLETQGNDPLQDREGLKLCSTDPWIWWARPAVGTPPAWFVEVDGGVTYHRYNIDLFQDCCSCRCEDDIAINLVSGDDTITCTSDVITIECSDTIEDDFEVDYRLTGKVRFAIREMISDTILQLSFRINCATGVLQRRVTRLSFIGSEVLAGRFCVEEFTDWIRLTTNSEDPICTVTDTTFYYNIESDLVTLLTEYCDSVEPALDDGTTACSVMTAMPDWDINSDTGLTYFCWYHFPWEEVDKTVAGGYYLEEIGDWHTVTAMDDAITVDVAFEDETAYEFHTCPQDDFEIKFFNDMTTLEFTPPASWTPLSCDFISSPQPVQEAAVPIPGLSINTFTLGDWFGSVTLEIELNTDNVGDECPERTGDCQLWDETDEWPGT